MPSPFSFRSLLARAAIAAALLALALYPAAAQSPPAHTLPQPVHFTAAQDHQNMMEQLGIRALRPGPSGNENDPNHANYDELLANPYPHIPNALRLNDGRPVSSAAMWWRRRRPQLVRMLEDDVYGRIPAHVPPVTWRVVSTSERRLGPYPVKVKELVGHVDNSACPLISLNLKATLVTPAHTTRKVPVLIMFGPSPFGSPFPSAARLAPVNAAFKKALAAQTPALAAVFARSPNYQPFAPFFFAPGGKNADGDPPSTQELIAAGWGFASFNPTSVQADSGAGITRGIIGLVNHGQPRTPTQWGALRAWAWGASRVLDYLQTDPEVDARHVGIEGVSRFGKAALVTMAFDPRFAMVLVGSSGKGGATLLRRNWGEAVESLTGGEYYWMAGNFMKYGESQGASGPLNPGDIPVDSNELIALCAPRLTFISYGMPSKGDAKWLDQRGSFIATVAAGSVFRLLGAHGIGIRGNPLTAQMPPINHGLLHGQLAWRQDDGGHTDAPNMKYFIAWVDRFIHYPPTGARQQQNGPHLAAGTTQLPRPARAARRPGVVAPQNPQQPVAR